MIYVVIFLFLFVVTKLLGSNGIFLLLKYAFGVILAYVSLPAFVLYFILSR